MLTTIAQPTAPVRPEERVLVLRVPLLTRAERQQLMANGATSLADPDGFDPEPVVRLVSPSLALVWLLTELDPLGSSDLAFGLIDRGEGRVDQACVDLAVLARVGGFRRDASFRATGPLSSYLACKRRPAAARGLAENASPLV